MFISESEAMGRHPLGRRAQRIRQMADAEILRVLQGIMNGARDDNDNNNDDNNSGTNSFGSLLDDTSMEDNEAFRQDFYDLIR